MRWIRASDLETWARSRLVSRTELASVVSDLIRATAADINAIRFPSGDKGQVRGFDGHLESAIPALNVPEGSSCWEIGTEENYQKKAQDEFQKRTREIAADIRRKTTFVFVTPWTWDSSKSDNKIEDWVAKKKSESSWRDVRYIDGSALEMWFDHCPAVAAWHARNTVRVSPSGDVYSTDEFWCDFTGRFSPGLTEEVLLCERDAQSRELLNGLMKPDGTITLVADSPDDVVAFAIAAIRKADPAVRLFLEARTLVVDSISAGRQLTANRRLVLLLRNDAAQSPAQFSELGPLLVPLGRAQRGNRADILSRPTSYGMGKAMTSMGLGESEAQTLARGCGRNLTALARLKPGGQYKPPAWKAHAESLLPAILAGGWDSRNAKDLEALEQIAGGTPYIQLERRLRSSLNEPDRPFDSEGTVWKVHAPMDAFLHVGDLITAAESEGLFKTLTSVFSFVAPEVDPKDPLGAFRAAASGHSEWLREGLATTLLLIAVWSEQARVNLGGESGQAFADRVIRDLPGLAMDHRLLVSLKNELPLLAEAAPGPLLSALEQLLEGDGERIRPIFDEKPDPFFPTSEHLGLLRALEMLAWDPEFFHQVIMILARLAKIDPGGKITNRPFRSLVQILLLWLPQTNASPERRLSALDDVVQLYPEIGWALTLSLLPTLHGVSDCNEKPKLREAGAADRKPVTYGELEHLQINVIQRAIDLADRDINRWLSLIPRLSTFPFDARDRAVAHLDQLLATLSETDRMPLWSKLRDEVNRHERFSSAPWALNSDSLKPLGALVERHAPADPVAQQIWLFDTWAVDDIADLTVSNKRRADVLKQLWEAGGVDIVFRIGTETKLPHLVVQAISDALVSETDLRPLVERSFFHDPHSQFTWGLVVLYRQIVGHERALTWLIGLRESGRLPDQLFANFLLGWPDEPLTWHAVRRLGSDLQISYWRQRPARLMKGPRARLLRALLMSLTVGRASIALESAANRLDDVPPRLLLRILDGLIPELNSGDRKPDTMLIYHVDNSLAALEKHADVGLVDIAKREYSLLALLQASDRSLRIHDLMAQDPIFYHQILREVFPAKSEPEQEIDSDARSRAVLGYSLLTNFHQLPGQTQTGIDVEVLACWVDGVRRLGGITDRTEITDNFVGRLFAHAPNDPEGGWPHRAVREQIERLRSDILEGAIRIERFNMRGVVSRGTFEGGKKERDLARFYQESAELAASWRRSSRLLVAIAKDWNEVADRVDVEAAQRRLKS